MLGGKYFLLSLNIVKFHSNLHQLVSDIQQFAGMDPKKISFSTGQAMC